MSKLSYILSTCLVLALYLVLYFTIDKSVAYTMVGWDGSYWYTLAKFFSALASAKLWGFILIVVFLMVGIAYLVRRHLSPYAHKLLLFGLSILLASLLGTILKIILARYRPIMLLEHNLYGFHFFSNNDLLNSTPSGHTLRVFSAVTAINLFFKPRMGWLLFLIAALCGLSRVVLGVHYLSDILLGAYVGIISTLLIKRAFYEKV